MDTWSCWSVAAAARPGRKKPRAQELELLPASPCLDCLDPSRLAPSSVAAVARCRIQAPRTRRRRIWLLVVSASLGVVLGAAAVVRPEALVARATAAGRHRSGLCRSPTGARRCVGAGQRAAARQSGLCCGPPVDGRAPALVSAVALGGRTHERPDLATQHRAASAGGGPRPTAPAPCRPEYGSDDHNLAAPRATTGAQRGMEERELLVFK